MRKGEGEWEEGRTEGISFFNLLSDECLGVGAVDFRSHQPRAIHSAGSFILRKPPNSLPRECNLRREAGPTT